MKRKAFFIIITLVSVVFAGSSQTTKVRINDYNLRGSRGSYEEFEVLSANPNIREGSYVRIIDKKPAIEGTYSNNKRCGIWKSYNSKHRVEYEIDYTNGTITYLDTDSISKKLIMKHDSIISNGDRPALQISGEYLSSCYYTGLLDYPYNNRGYNYNISGTVVVGVNLDKQGLITGYSIINSMRNPFDIEALSTIKLIPMEFLPQYKNGIPVESQYNIWVRFVRDKFD